MQRIIHKSNRLDFKPKTKNVVSVHMNDTFVMDIQEKDKTNFANSLDKLLKTFEIYPPIKEENENA